MYIEQTRHEDFCDIRSAGNGELVFQAKHGSRLSSYPEEIIARKSPFKAPLVVHLELTRKCGLQCKHCYISAGEPRENELSVQEWKTIIKQLKEMEVLSVYFTGGDPLLHEGCIELLAYARELGLSCNLLTNGLKLKHRGVLKSVPKEVFLVLSFDGQKGTQILRGIPGEEILKVVDLLRREDRAFAIQGVVFNENIGEMIKTFAWSMREGIDFCTNSIYPIGRTKENMSLLLGKEHFSDLLRLESISNQYMDEVKITRPEHSFANPNLYYWIADLVKKTNRPEPGLFVAYVSSDGYFYADNYYAGENWNPTHNLRTHSLKYAWEHAFEEERSIHLFGINCGECQLAKVSGYCDLANMAMSQQLHGSANHYLFHERKSLCQSGYVSIRRSENL